MRFTHAFIDRPVLATVVSIFIALIGLGALFVLPVSQYPEIVPPTVQVTTSYPGASADVVSQTVATPLEQEINGVENMLYMSSQSTGDGKLTITVTFSFGTDLNVAQMLTQNRVQDALPRLPEDVQRLGVQVRKSTPTILLAVHLYSPDATRDMLYLSNYATLHIKDALARLPGVGDVQLFGARDYAMRIWLDPDKVAAYRLNATEVLAALRAQNVQVSAGVLNQPPVPGHGAYQVNVQTLGRLSKPDQFADIVVKTDDRGRVTRIRDIGWVEVGAAGLRVHRLHGPQRRIAAADLRPARRKFARSRGGSAVDDGGAEEGLSGRRRFDRHLRPDDLRCEVREGSGDDDLHRRAAGRCGCHPVPADVARVPDPHHCDPNLVDRHLCGALCFGDIAEQSVAVRVGARGRYRRR